MTGRGRSETHDPERRLTGSRHTDYPYIALPGPTYSEKFTLIQHLEFRIAPNRLLKTRKAPHSVGSIPIARPLSMRKRVGSSTKPQNPLWIFPLVRRGGYCG